MPPGWWLAKNRHLTNLETGSDLMADILNGVLGKVFMHPITKVEQDVTAAYDKYLVNIKLKNSLAQEKVKSSCFICSCNHMTCKFRFVIVFLVVNQLNQEQRQPKIYETLLTKIKLLEFLDRKG